jgi:hypothetical protein
MLWAIQTVSGAIQTVSGAIQTVSGAIQTADGRNRVMRVQMGITHRGIVNFTRWYEVRAGMVGVSGVKFVGFFGIPKEIVEQTLVKSKYIH